MEQQRPDEDEIEAPGIALFFRRSGPRDAPGDEREPDSAPAARGEDASQPPVVGSGPPVPALDELAQRVTTLAQEAAARYAAWARSQADALLVAAREQAAAEVAQAEQNVATILADAQATAQGMLLGADAARAAAEAVLTEARATAEAVLAEAIAKAEALLRAAVAEAEETRQHLLRQLRSATQAIERDILSPQAAGHGQSKLDGLGRAPSATPAPTGEPASEPVAPVERERWTDQPAAPCIEQTFLTDQPVVAVIDALADLAERAPADTPAPSDGRDTAGPLTGKGRIIAVYGANGGIGKTFIAVNLAAALARSTRGRIAIVDGNLQFGEVAARLRLPVDRTIYSLATLGSNLNWPAVRGVVYGHRSGLDAIVAPPQPWLAEHVSSELLVGLLGLLQDHYPYVVVDTHTSYDQKTLAALDQADDILVVATQDQFVRRNALSFITVAKRLGYLLKVRVVLNRFDERQAPALDRIEKELRSRVIATIRADPPGVARREGSGDPLVTVDDAGLAARDLVSLAAAVAGLAVSREGSSRGA